MNNSTTRNSSNKRVSRCFKFLPSRNPQLRALVCRTMVPALQTARLRFGHGLVSKGTLLAGRFRKETGEANPGRHMTTLTRWIWEAMHKLGQKSYVESEMLIRFLAKSPRKMDDCISAPAPFPFATLPFAYKQRSMVSSRGALPFHPPSYMDH